MKLPRFSIASIMAIIVITSINLAAFRAIDEIESVLGAMLILGALPMASILAWSLPGLVITQSTPREPRHFLLGFQAIGWTILLLYAIASALFTVPVFTILEERIYVFLNTVGIELTVNSGAGLKFELAYMLLLLLLQLAFAAAAGWFHLTFKIIVQRR